MEREKARKLVRRRKLVGGKNQYYRTWVGVTNFCPSRVISPCGLGGKFIWNVG